MSSVSVSHLQHKLELVEASRKRYQKAALGGSQKLEAVLEMTTHELSEAEDKLARLQAEHEEALRKTELDLCNLRDRCAVLEAEQHADVDACATSRCLTDTPQVRRAYLAGKTEGQRESIAAHTKVESLSQALETTEKKALSANVQLLELKGKYHQTLQDKVKLQRQLRALQDKLHEIHLQQVETLSSVITNTTRADQMNRRVWDSLDKALTSKQATTKLEPASVSLLTAENTMLRDALLSSMQHVDAGSTSASMHVAQAMSHVESGSAIDVAVHQVSAADLSNQVGVRAGSGALEPTTPPPTSESLQSNYQQVPEKAGDTPAHSPVSRKLSKGVSFSRDVMFETLKTVLQSKGVNMQESQEFHGQDDSQNSLYSSSQSESSGSESTSEWSGDELLAEHDEQEMRRISGSTGRVTISFSGMLQSASGSAQDRHVASRDLDDELMAKEAEEQGVGQSFSRSSISLVRRKDSVELSRRRLAARFKAPALALGACSYLQKLAHQRRTRDECQSCSGTDAGKGSQATENLGTKDVHAPNQEACAPDISEAKQSVKSLQKPGALWAAFKQKGQGNTAKGIEAAVDGFTEDNGAHTAAADAPYKLVDASAAHSPSSPAPTQQEPVVEVATRGSARVLGHVPPHVVPQAGARLSGHVSPVQSLSSTGTGLVGSHVASPDARRCHSPAGLSPDHMADGAYSSHQAIRAIESMSPYQDSEIASLEEQATRMHSFTHQFGSPPSTRTQAGIAPTMWEQSTWKNSIEDAAGHCARQILLQTPIMAAAQDFVQLGRLHTSSRTHTTAGAQTAWKSGITGTHTSGYKAKQAGEQYAATVMQSSPSYKLPYAVAQPTSRFPSASYALRD